MTEILSTVFIAGAGLTDSLEAWVLAVIGVVIAVDLIVGLRHTLFLALGALQIVGMIGGFLWAYWLGVQQDVSGPYAWALVVGTWCIVTIMLHFAVAVFKLTKLLTKP